MANFYVINSPLINYFFYNAPFTQDGPNVPLALGTISFFADEDHSVELPTFSDVSDPNNPVENTNPIVLGQAGECPLFYLEDRLYYIVIKDKNGAEIRTIEHYDPSNGGGGSATETIPNYIPNGQFRLHNNLPKDGIYEVGQIREDVTDIAQGNWKFVRTPGTTSINFVTFEPYGQYISNPPANPKFSARIRCTEPDTGDSKRDFLNRFPNVNTFATDSNQQYTFSFYAIDNNASNLPVKLIVVKNFGSGGSPETETVIKTFNLAAIETQYVASFSFGDNSGKTIGPNGDDYVDLVLRPALDEGCDFSVTDFIEKAGVDATPDYPETTQQEDISNALGGGFPIPDYDGMNLGLTAIQTKNGWKYDNSVIGMIMPTLLRTAPDYWLLGDGISYPYNGYSNVGIPYRRIGDVLWDNSGLFFITGTGYQFVTAQLSDVTSPGAQFRLSTNQAGAQTAAADGAIATGFTFKSVATGGNYGMTGKFGGVEDVWIKNNTQGNIYFSAGTSGFNTGVYKDYETSHASSYGLYELGIVVAVATLVSKYFNCGLDAGTHYYPWFTVDGVGVDPAPGGTPIPINLFSDFNASEIGKIICEAVSGKTISEIICVDASSITAGSYWRFSANSQEYLVYQVKDGIGNDPALPNVISIPANISSTYTAAQVATANITAINKFYVGMPDLRGWSFRVWNNGANMDPQASTRFGSMSNLTGDALATYQWDAFMDHQHNFTASYTSTAESPDAAGGGGAFHFWYGSPATISGQTTYANSNLGGPETRSADFYINALIKY